MKQKYWIAVALAALYLALLFRYAYIGPRRNFSDFRVYYWAATQFQSHGELYGVTGQGLTPFKYPPTFAFLISPLAYFSKKTASLIFFSLNFAALLVFFNFSKKLIVTSALSAKESLLFYLIPAVFSYRFIQGVLDAGQVTLCLCALTALGLDLIEKERPALGAMFLGLAVILKYTPFIFIPYLWVKKKKAAILWVIFFIMLYGLLPAAVTGLSRQIHYLKGWLPSIQGNSLDQGSWTDHKNQSLPSLVARALMKNSPYESVHSGFSVCAFSDALKIGLGISLALYLMILWRGAAGESDSGFHPAELGMLFLGMALWNANAWPFNFCVFIFGVMAALEFGRRRGQGRFLPAGLLLAFILANIGSQALAGERGQWLGEIFSLLSISGLVIYGILLYWKIADARSHPLLR